MGRARAALSAGLARRLLVNCTQSTVIRLLPAMNITEEQVEEGCDILCDVIANLRPRSDAVMPPLLSLLSGA